MSVHKPIIKRQGVNLRISTHLLPTSYFLPAHYSSTSSQQPTHTPPPRPMTENVPGADLPVQALVVRSIGVFNELVGTIPKPPPKEYLVAHGVAQKTADAYRGFMQTGRRTVAAEGALPDVAALRPLSVASPAGSDDERIRFQAEYQKAKTAFSTYKYVNLLPPARRAGKNSGCGRWDERR